MDVSGSMYRFNSYDGRLDRTIEAALMVMEACQNVDNIKVIFGGYLAFNSVANVKLVQAKTLYMIPAFFLFFFFNFFF